MRLLLNFLRRPPRWLTASALSAWLCVVMVAEAADPWEEAENLRRAGQYLKAVEKYSALIQGQPNEARGYIERGRTFWRMGDLDAAIADLDRAVALAPMKAMRADIYNIRGLVLRDKKLWDQARLDLDQAINLYPNNGLYFYNRGLIWVDLGELERALADYTRAIVLDKWDSFAYKQRCYVRVQLGFYELALADGARAVEINPRDALAYFYRADAYEGLGDEERALADLNQAIALDPQLAVAHNNRGFLLASRGDHEQAIDALSRAIQLQPQYTSYNNRGYSWLELGRLDQAMADFNRAVELNPRDALAYYYRAATWLKKGDPAAAAMDATKSIELDPQEARAYRIRSQAREALKDPKGAKQDAWWATVLGPKPRKGTKAIVDPEILARERTALKAFLSEDTPATRSRLAAIRHDHAFAILNSTQPPTKRWALEEAAAFAQSATALEPNVAGHWLLQGMIFRELSQRDKRAQVLAEQALRQAVEVDPEYAPAWLELGMAMLEEGRNWEAMTALERAIEADPSRTIPLAFGPLIAMYVLNDQGCRGLQFFREMHLANPEVSALGIGTALMLYRNGDIASAREQVRDIMILEEAGTYEHDQAAALLDEWEREDHP